MIKIIQVDLGRTLFNESKIKWAVELQDNFSLLLSYKCVHSDGFQLTIHLPKIPFHAS